MRHEACGCCEVWSRHAPMRRWCGKAVATHPCPCRPSSRPHQMQTHIHAHTHSHACRCRVHTHPQAQRGVAGRVRGRGAAARGGLCQRGLWAGAGGPGGAGHAAGCRMAAGGVHACVHGCMAAWMDGHERSAIRRHGPVQRMQPRHVGGPCLPACTLTRAVFACGKCTSLVQCAQHCMGCARVVRQHAAVAVIDDCLS